MSGPITNNQKNDMYLIFIKSGKTFQFLKMEKYFKGILQ